LLWPKELAVNPPGPDSQLEMADVRVLVSGQVLSECLHIMLADAEADSVDFYTVGAGIAAQNVHDISMNLGLAVFRPSLECLGLPDHSATCN
jgi:hypothetical protein